MKTMLSFEHYVGMNNKIIYQGEKIIKYEEHFKKLEQKIIKQ